MAYYDVGPYILSDDFEVFLKLLNDSPPVLYYNPFKNPERIILREATTKTIGCQIWHIKKKFIEQGWLFLDPRTQFDPERYTLKMVLPNVLEWTEETHGMLEKIRESRMKLFKAQQMIGAMAYRGESSYRADTAMRRVPIDMDKMRSF